MPEEKVHLVTEDEWADLKTTADQLKIVHSLQRLAASQQQGTMVQRMRRMLFTFGALSFVLGALLMYVVIALWFNPLDRLTRALRESSAASRLLERFEEKKP